MRQLVGTSLSLALAVLSATGLVACEKQTAPEQSRASTPSSTSSTSPGTSEGEASNAPSTSSPSKGRMIAREASLELEAERPREVAERAEAIARKAGGRVSKSQTGCGRRGGDRAESTLRVPADAFREVLGSIEKLGTVTRRSISTEDVTSRHRDLAARLASQRQMEQRLRTLLTKTDSVEEILTIEKELADVRSRIEKLESEKEALEDRVSHSTIRLTVLEPDRGRAESSVWNEIASAAESGAEQSVDVLTGLIYLAVALSPLMLLGLALVGLVRWWWRRRFSTERDHAPDESAETPRREEATEPSEDVDTEA